MRETTRTGRFVVADRAEVSVLRKSESLSCMAPPQSVSKRSVYDMVYITALSLVNESTRDQRTPVVNAKIPQVKCRIGTHRTLGRDLARFTTPSF
jgi:hypothetical protein